MSLSLMQTTGCASYLSIHFGDTMKADRWQAENMRIFSGKLSALIQPVTSCVVALAILFDLGAGPALACSWVNDAAARADSVTTSNYYGVTSILIGLAIIWLELRRRWLSPIMLLAAALVVFHPARTVGPNYYPDCSFVNVQASQAVLIILCLLLGYRLLRIYYRRRSERQAGRAVY
jgi:hypothetical protein